MPPPLPLKKLQSLLLQLITAPEGGSENIEQSPLFKLLPIRGDEKLSSSERLEIYANMYFYRILDVLKEDFPALVQVLGEVDFHNLITDYLVQHPSKHYSLRYAGRSLPLFLKDYPPFRKKPYLSKLAEFEWLLLAAFDAPDAEIFTSAHLKALKPAQWGRIALKLSPAFHLFEADWRVDQIREHALKKKPISQIKTKKVVFKIWRKNFKVFYAPVELTEQRLLEKIQKGMTLGELCEQAAEFIPAEKIAPTLSKYLETWVQEDFLIGKP